MTQAPAHLVKLLHDCERVARLSDRMVKVGPLTLGIDSALALLPIGGGLYTVGLGGWLLVGVDALTAEVPILGAAVDMLFPGHILAVRALRTDLEKRFGPIPAESTRRRRSWSDFGQRARDPARA